MRRVVDKTMFRSAVEAGNSAVSLNALGLFPSECHFILNVNFPFFFFFHFPEHLDFYPPTGSKDPSISTCLCVKLIRLKVILNVFHESW